MVTPAVLPLLMMLPPPCCFMIAVTYLRPRKQEPRLVMITRLKSSSAKSSGLTKPWPMPALLNSTSTRPHLAMVASTMAFTSASTENVGADEQGTVAEPVGQGLAQFFTAGGDDDTRPFGHEQLHRAGAHPTVAAGDDGDLVCKSSWHCCLLVRAGNVGGGGGEVKARAGERGSPGASLKYPLET